MKTLFIFRGDTQGRLLRDPQAPRDFLYGYAHYEKSKTYILAPRERKGFWSKLFYLIEKPFAKLTLIGLPLEIFPLFRKEIQNTQVVFCINDPNSLALLFFKWLGLVKPKVVVLMQSLPERVKYFQKKSWMIFFLRCLLKKADRVLTLSESAHIPLKNIFAVSDQKLKTFYFGVDEDFWRADPGAKRENFLLAVGNDMNRDYKTLIEALPSETELVIVTTKNIPSTKNCRVLKNISDQELRKLYQTCAATIVPSITITYESSGLSCSLQAMACGSPVIASAAPAITELFMAGRDMLFYQAEDAQDLRKKIQRLQEDKNLSAALGVAGAALVKEKFTAKKMSSQLDIFLSNF